MNPATVSFARCLKHPSQFSTGFCSSCLVERLSNVYTADRGPRRPKEEDEISIFASPSDFDQKNHKTRERRTLLNLFHLEDEFSLDLEREARASRNHSTADAKIQDDAIESETIGSSISRSLEASQATKHSPASSESSKKSGSSFRISSSFPMKLLWRRSKPTESGSSFPDVNQKNSLQEDELSRGKRSSRHSWEGTEASCDLPKSTHLRNSRRSLDSMVINKAFSCPFSCAKETQLEERIADPSTSRRRSCTDLSEELTIDASTSTNAKSEKVPKEEKAKRWSKMWRWSFTSPFRELGHSRQPSLERSLSEPSHERRRTKVAEVSKPGTMPQIHGNGMGKLRQSLYPSKRRDRERNFNRSKSAHFSPRNVSSGLLRFYLTPLRSNRRSANRSRSRTSYSFGPGLFGIH